MKTQIGKRTLESAICVLCGEREATTKEHIPPRALFVTKPRVYLSVPACEKCNHSTKLEDEYLLHVMSGGSLWGLGRDVWNDKVRPKLQTRPKTRFGLRNQLSVRNLKINPDESMHFPVILINRQRVEKSLRKLVYGFYWWHTDTILSKHAEVKFQMLNPVDGPRYFDDPKNKEFFDQTVMGVYADEEVRKTFFYTIAISNDLALFYFFFYKQNVFIAAVHI
jgi:hypothetical protein